MNQYIGLSAAMLVMVLSFQAGATQTGDQIGVTFHGVLKQRPCHINGDRDIEVHFGNVGINKVDGSRYLQKVSYSLLCDDPDAGVSLMLSVKGTPTSFDLAAVSTSANGLGIRILQDGKPFTLNGRMKVTYKTPPKLEVVPVKDPGVALVENPFTATATLLAEYE
ncbi:fimbrial protein [Serratia proteamaculans]|uniref:fimbrial protein n=1 Tax=Serratia proteamaculans TaxID=28151 RepID=UPI0021798E07|nr:fimbrial protein [Serratia proteamaculans]CAI0968469.1 putative minor fimbrial subunit StfF [Serratia proteamaculans]CAI1711119.1 putative minor fimbrial subunit StfF [Serratia proteamaculans]